MATETESKQVNTAKVAGRRTLRFESMQEVLDELDRLEHSEVELLGNWSLGQIYAHLARGFDGAVDGVPRTLAPWYFRIIGPLVKRRVLKGRLAAGFKIPRAAEAALIPDQELPPEQGLRELREAIGRFDREKRSSRHPVFGELTAEEWTQLMLRHCELHLSFVLPLDAGHQN